ncbi:MAG: hypothetical protein BWK79_19350 [Beggiatoa sp. IS2]|nr:MAG: hypothetical protein BWK79_19350 [Beggiatoa sp. IS2]
MDTLMRRGVNVEIVLSDGSILTGSIMIDRNIRLSDSLNNRDKYFIVLVDQEKQAQIVNKRHIVKMMEIQKVDEELDIDIF